MESKTLAEKAQRKKLHFQQVNFSLKRDAFEVLKKRATDSDLKPGGLARREVLESLTKSLFPSKDELVVLSKLNYELGAIGRNVNQIARHLNSLPGAVLNLSDEKELRLLKELLGKIHEELLHYRSRRRKRL